ncbi:MULTISPECIES: gliding motility-associated ABC transporter permease subunit GldF [Reichenbachiella]|uniref:Protein involved in gliding motility GldF n=1 Tax=Reichenbachiella agariperforans TaxID=156994 RepID=A0A1M6LR50_REIAG|nr:MULTISPECIES: gliding motility-associated ABC transporter permease subunit GldF [Reichenbachiella]MBU2914026.1 gliding motility-associated ABC transporter permease subunit GldF [Reichenbachiella agariperforans]RJE74066.1 gliding motility-associated ABC transporter permease subunit GldF [Reichenbachiella sp. MSK19-1]SHJ73667.1 protein involved in gliding motility GldF [Reichenbachiella agariperforans]
MFAVFIKEINSFLNSLIAYIVIAVFLTTIGLLMWVFPESSILEYGYADMSTLFNLGPYVFMFLIPAITMRFFAEEKRTGTNELLFTRPMTAIDIIMGKYLAGFVLVVLSVLPTLLYFYSVYQLGKPVGNLDISGTVGSYIGLLLLGGVFVSIGVFASAITDNQVVAFVVAVFLSFVLYSGLESLAAIDIWGASALILQQLSIVFHYGALSRGLIDMSDIVYFLSVIGVMLLLTKLVLDARKWS